MVRHTQTIRQFLPMNCLGVFDHFVGLALKGLRRCKWFLYSRISPELSCQLMFFFYQKKEVGDLIFYSPTMKRPY